VTCQRRILGIRWNDFITCFVTIKYRPGTRYRHDIVPIYRFCSRYIDIGFQIIPISTCTHFDTISRIVMQRYIVQRIYRVDIGIVSTSRKISKFRYIVIVPISFQYGRNDVDVVYLFSFFVGKQSIKLWYLLFKSVVIMHCPSLIIIPHIYSAMLRFEVQ